MGGAGQGWPAFLAVPWAACVWGCCWSSLGPPPCLALGHPAANPSPATPPSRLPRHCHPLSTTPRRSLPAPPQGVCTLHYKGPEAIGYGLRAAVRDKFPDLVEVLMMDPDTGEPIKFQA